MLKSDRSKKLQNSPKVDSLAKDSLTYTIINTQEQSFGYDVFAKGKLLIHQQSIPAIAGNKGFETKTDAEKVAQMVISKIKKGEMPPSVSVDEMKKLKVIK